MRPATYDDHDHDDHDTSGSTVSIATRPGARW
jgi:hypothetical protein